MSDWSHLFVGRSTELESIKESYLEAAQGKTKVIALVAESGFGKTRLVQEFYNWLSTHHDDVGGTGYWPDRLLKKEDNLLINPDCRDCGLTEKGMPFLWWGLRFSDPTGRNEIIGGALWAGLDDLKAHLGIYQKAIEKAKNAKTVLSRVINAAATIGSPFTCGLLGPLVDYKDTLEKLKAGGELVSELIDRHTIGQRNDLPVVAQQRARDELCETILADLHALAKSPPAKFSPIPLVLVLDDAQWLPQDKGAAAFVSMLIERGRRESWPMLVVMTSWEKEWRENLKAKTLPAALFDSNQGDKMLHIQHTEGLDELVLTAFPGLATNQRETILKHVDGNPRFLDEVLLYLQRNRKHFVDRDLTGQLKPGWQEEIATMDFQHFVADRFGKAPQRVRQALALASMQGAVFSARMVTYMAENLYIQDVREGLREGDDPHSFSTFESHQKTGEFRTVVYHNVAVNDLENHLEKERVRQAFDLAQQAVVDNVENATEHELELVFETILTRMQEKTVLDHSRASNSPEILELGRQVIKVASALIRLANARSDIRTAGEIAQKIFDLGCDVSELAETTVILNIVGAYWAWHVAKEQFVDLLGKCLEKTKKNIAEHSDRSYQRQLVEVLFLLAEAIRIYKGTVAARPICEEHLAACRVLVQEQNTPNNRRELAVALSKHADMIADLESLQSARPFREESVIVLRALVKEHNTPGNRRNLAMVLSKFADMIAALESPDTARPLHEEAVALCRALALEQDTDIDRRLLVISLSNYADMIAVMNDSYAELPLREEEVELCRALVQEQGTPLVLRYLTIALSNYADVIDDLKGAAATRTLREENVALCRALAQEHGKPSDHRELAVALSKYAVVVAKLENFSAARPFFDNAVALYRMLVQEQGRHDDCKLLALALSTYADMLAISRDTVEERSLRKEVVMLPDYWQMLFPNMRA